jgi:CheY-like chemotaxis protein
MHPSVHDEPSMPRPRILVADSDALCLRAICRLTKREFDVTAAASSAEAIAEIQRAPTFDGIVLDVALFARDATAVHQQLMIDHPAQARRVVYLTLGLNGGVTLPVGASILRKPFSVAELKGALEKLV